MGTITITSAGFGTMANGKGGANGSKSVTLSDSAMNEFLNWMEVTFPPVLDEAGQPIPRTNVDLEIAWITALFNGVKDAVSKKMKDADAQTAREAQGGITIT